MAKQGNTTYQHLLLWGCALNEKRDYKAFHLFHYFEEYFAPLLLSY